MNSGNLLGENFPEFVKKQVDIRQKLYSKRERNNEVISYLNSNTVWTRLVSGINLESDNEVVGSEEALNKRIERLEIGDFYKGSELAKRFILTGGVAKSTDIENQKFSIKQGFATNKSIMNDFSYGFGGTEFGIVPMPGILSVNVKHENNGSLRRADVNIRAYNKKQFEIIETLFLRIGYNMLLEWGHTIYWNNEDKYIPFPGGWNTATFKFLQEGHSPKDITDAILEFREKNSGNYDGMMGKVTNFSWNFNKEGYYNITINLISIGDIIESLKVNKLTSSPLNNTNKINKDFDENIDTEYILSHKDDNDLSRILYERFEDILNTRYNELKKIKDRDVRTTSSISNDGGYYELRLPGKPSETGGNKYYITFGNLLNIIEENLFIFDERTSEPIISFFKGESLMPITPMHLSTDLDTCIIKNSFPFLKKYNNGEIPIIFKELNDFQYPTSIPNVLYGNIMNIYINVAFILKQLQTLQNPDTGDISLIDLLNKICEGINYSFAGLNLLQPYQDDITNTIYIIDQKPFPSRKELIKEINSDSFQETTSFSMYNYNNTGSFITDFTFKTELTPQFSTMITVGAQAQNKVVGEDSTAFSNWNKGLIDRIIPSKIDKYEKDNLTKKIDVFNRFFSSLNEYKKFIRFFMNPTVAKSSNYFDSKDSLRSILINVISALQQIQALNKDPKSNISSNSGLGWLPINLSLEMKGLAGMRIFETFNIDQKFLPSNYPESLEFIIKNISHKIDTNGWYTTIESFSIPPTVNPVIVDENLFSLNGLDISTAPSEFLAVVDNLGLFDISSNLSTPNADRLRVVLKQLNYTEKSNSLSQVGDITTEMADLAIKVFKIIKSQLPNLKINVTSGNDYYHKNLPSRHKDGRGIDFTISDLSSSTINKIVDILDGFVLGNYDYVRYLNEYSNMSKNATGGHFHLSWGKGTEGQLGLESANVKEGRIPIYKV